VRKMSLLLVLVATTTLLAAGVAFTQVPESGGADRYIVVLENDVDSPSWVARDMNQRQNLEVGFVYSNALEGFSAKIADDSVAAVRANPRVAYVERDGVVRAAAQTLPWGVDRIQADRSSTRAGNGRGAVSNVNVYIIDSGVDRSHPDLNVVRHVNFRGDGRNRDCSGHGTHVAGTVAAKDNARAVVGVAPGARVTGVKVLSCDDTGTRSMIIEGIDWVTAKATKPAVANLSLTGPPSRALDAAVRRSVARGVFYSVAAGNQDRNACNFSPARAAAGTNNGIVATAATNKSNAERPGSNFGRCVDLWAPGAEIRSTKRGGGTTLMSGSSMAAAHVGGAGALYLSSRTRGAPAAVERALKADSVRTRKFSEDGRRIRLLHVGGY
jgi:subtilisin family serine protease